MNYDQLKLKNNYFKIKKCKIKKKYISKAISIDGLLFYNNYYNISLCYQRFYTKYRNINLGSNHFTIIIKIY